MNALEVVFGGFGGVLLLEVLLELIFGHVHRVTKHARSMQLTMRILSWFAVKHFGNDFPVFNQRGKVTIGLHNVLILRILYDTVQLLVVEGDLRTALLDLLE